MEKVYITAEEFAKLANLARPTVYNLARTNTVDSIKIGGKLCFPQDAVEAYLKRPIKATELNSDTPVKKQIDYWMIPRSVRKLVGIQEMIKNDFQNGIIGSQWKGTRANHLKRDKMLQDTGIRGKSADGFVDDNPGGARTDVALLAALGFYAFDSQGNIELTYQGEQMLISTNPASIITEQLMQFRYPSPYSVSINMASDIHIAPYRFLLKLLLEPKLMDNGDVLMADNNIRISQKEIASFVITAARTDNDFDKVVDLILSNRISGNTLKPSDKLNNIANTFINNLEITGFIERGKKSTIWLREDAIEKVYVLLEKPIRKFSYEVGNENEFQHRLGMDPTKSKLFGRLSSNRRSGEFAVAHLLMEELKNNPMTSNMITRDLISKLADHAGTSYEIANAVVEEHLKTKPEDVFSKQYLTYSNSGRTFARDFEITTKKIFDELLNNESVKWTGKKGKSPDVTFSLSNLNCIVDCKAAANYNISNDHFNRMTADETGYIPAYNAKVFIYIANGFGKNFVRNLKSIERKTEVPGSGITAEIFLYLLEEHRKHPFTEEHLLQLFTSSKIITMADINELRNQA